MGEQEAKYILLRDADGRTPKRNIFTFGLSMTSTRTEILKGSLLKELPEAEQPQDLTKVALVGIDCLSLRLETDICRLERLTDEDANLLLAISSLQERCETFKTRFHWGRQISLGSKVSVSVRGFSTNLPGVVWYKGESPSNSGTMFGVELTVTMSAFINV